MKIKICCNRKACDWEGSFEEMKPSTIARSFNYYDCPKCGSGEIFLKIFDGKIHWGTLGTNAGIHLDEFIKDIPAQKICSLCGRVRFDVSLADGVWACERCIDNEMH